MAIKSRVREYRKVLGWSQERLAKESGVSRSAVCDAESRTESNNLFYFFDKFP